MHDDSNPRDAEFITEFTKPDPSSHANSDAVRMTDLFIDWIVDFEQRKLIGHCVSTFRVHREGGAKIIVLDVNNVAIDSITFGSTAGENVPADYWISRTACPLGQALVIQIPFDNKKDDTFTVKITYATSETASALQWMTKDQSIGKEHPFLFSQCQAIHARSIVPLQDTPGVKFTYRSRVAIPSHFNAVMSAVPDVDQDVAIQPDDSVFDYNGIAYRRLTFTQKVPMPSYLLAITAGNLAFRKTSHRTGVLAEPEIIEAAAKEFEDLEKIVCAAEELFGEYVWGTYNVAVMNLNFGGMENPNYTFLTTSILAGDKSLVNVVLHECTHSWFGNLLTCETWEHFWLNEGFCVFGEQKLVEYFNGSSEKDLHAIIGWNDLKESVSGYLDKGLGSLTRLVVSLDGDVDPDDAFSSVPYFSGSSFLRRLEEKVGVAAMNSFLKAYVDHFKFTSFNSFHFQHFFLEFMKSQSVPDAVLDSIDFALEFSREGLPPYPTTIDDSRVRDCLAASRALLEGTLHGVGIADGWTANQIVVFLDDLIERQMEDLKEGDLVAGQEKWKAFIRKVADFYPFESTKNAELRFRFITLKLRAAVPDANSEAADMVKQYGRMKFVRPLYRDMFKSKTFRDFSVKFFEEHSHIYHPTCATMVKRDMEAALKNEFSW